MSEIRYAVKIISLGPVEPREIVHIVDGTQIRAEIVDANSRHFRVEVSEPFQQVLARTLPLFVVGLTPFRFVGDDGRATFFLTESLNSALEGAYIEWRRLKADREHFLADRDVLEPLIRAAHQDAAECCNQITDLVECLQSFGDSLETEMLLQRRELRQQFKAGCSTQAEFQSGLKALRKNGPANDLGLIVLTSAERLQTNFKALYDRLQHILDAFNLQCGLKLNEAAGFLGLPTLPIPPHEWWVPVDGLVNLSVSVRSLLRGVGP